MTARSHVRPLLVALLVCLFPCAALAKVKVYGGVDPTTITAGGSAELRIVVEGPRGDEATIDLPHVSGLKIQRPAVVVPELAISTTVVNGRMTQRRTATYHFTVIGVQPGTHTIKPFPVRVPGQRVEYTPQMKVVVKKSKAGGQPLAYLEANPRQRTVYVGEPVVVDLRLGLLLPYAKNEIPDQKTIFLPKPTTNVGLDEIPESTVLPTRPTLEVPSDKGAVTFYESTRQKDYEIYERTLRWMPRQPGTYSFQDATYSAQIATRVERVRGFFEDRLVARDVQTVLATTDPFTVKVKPLPKQGRPPTFSGLIGRIDQKVSVDRTQVAVGESLKLTREISGDGNIDFVDPPPIVLPDGYKTFGTLVQREPGRVLQILDFAPRHNDATVVPGIELSVFDTSRGVYVTQKSPPIELVVQGSAGEALSLLPGAVNAATDLRGLKLERSRDPRLPGRTATLLVMLPLAFGFAGMLWGRSRRQAAANPAQVKRKSAPRSLQQRLNALHQLERPADVAHGVRQALAAYLGQLTDEPEAKYLHDLREALGDRVSPELLDALVSLTSSCDQITFGGVGRDATALVERLRKLSPRIRKELG